MTQISITINPAEMVEHL